MENVKGLIANKIGDHSTVEYVFESHIPVDAETVSNRLDAIRAKCP